MASQKNKPDITLEEALQKTKEAGFSINFEKGQTVAVDLFELKKDIAEAKSQIHSIHWIIGVFVIALLVSVLTIFSDYFQFATHAYKDFTATMNEKKIDHNDIQSIKTDIELIKQNLQNLNRK